MADEEPPDNVINLGERARRTGGSGPQGPNVEFRLGRLETAVDNIQRDIQALRVDVGRIDGKISNMPTTVTLLGLVVAVLAAGFGMALAVAKLASGH